MTQPKKTIACIFDLDGVLVDTAVYHYKAWKQLANELGFDFSVEQNEKLKGVNRMRSLDMILGWGGVEKSDAEKEELAALKNKWYVEMISKMTTEELLPGTIQLLEELRRNDVSMALGSASKNSALILERTGIRHFFNAIVDGNSVTTSKPDPEVFLKAAELLQASPSECIVFEDAEAGVEAAIAAQMLVVGIGSTVTLPDADLVISNLSEIDLSGIIKLRNK